MLLPSRTFYQGKLTTSLIIALVAVLSSCLGLLAALDAGTLVMLPAADLSQNAGFRTTALEALERAVQRLIFLDMDFRHLFSLPPIHPVDPGCSLGPTTWLNG